MAKTFTLEDIAQMPPDRRLRLFMNAQNLDTEEARAVVNLIEESGLPLKEGGGLPAEHPAILKMEEIASSVAGRAALKKAADEGFPALFGLDAIFKAELDGHYGQFDTTSWAGTIVARQMYAMGYKQIGKAKMPPGCVSKTAALFR